MRESSAGELDAAANLSTMPTQELKRNSPSTREARPAAWIPVIIPALKARWASYASDPPASQALPNFSDWLILLHAAATTPWKIPRHLSQLLNMPKSGAELQSSWVTLTQLFSLTFQAARPRPTS